jgi:hypothetical protein
MGEDVRTRRREAAERALRTLEPAAMRDALIGHPGNRVIAYRDCTSAFKPALVKPRNDCGGTFTVARIIHWRKKGVL